MAVKGVPQSPQFSLTHLNWPWAFSGPTATSAGKNINYISSSYHCLVNSMFCFIIFPSRQVCWCRNSKDSHSLQTAPRGPYIRSIKKNRLEDPISTLLRTLYKNREKKMVRLVWLVGFWLFLLLDKFWGTTQFFFRWKIKTKGRRKWKVFECIVGPVLRAVVLRETGCLPRRQVGRCRGTADDSRITMTFSGDKVPQ